MKGALCFGAEAFCLTVHFQVAAGHYHFAAVTFEKELYTWAVSYLSVCVLIVDTNWYLQTFVSISASCIARLRL